MRPDLPWSVAGISTEARDAARAAARREGLSVGEWLTRRIVSELSDMSEPRSQWSFRSESRPQPERQRFQSDDMLEHVARSETETAELNRRIEDQLRGMARRLDASERSQTESSRVISKAAVEMNIAAREQAQAFDQLGVHVADLADRLDRVEGRESGEGLRDAVKALHTGLSRLADQITATANQSATQISSLAGNLETVAGRVGQARQDAMAATQALEGRLGALDERVRSVETAGQAQAGAIDHALAAIDEQRRMPSPMDAISRLEDSVRRLEDRGTDPGVERRLSAIERTMSDLMDRIESRDDSSHAVDQALRSVMVRLEGLETAQREAAAELRRAAKPIEPEPAAPPPVVAPPVGSPSQAPVASAASPAAAFGSLPAFEPPPFAAEVPPFAVAAPPPFADAQPNTFELPPDAGLHSGPTDTVLDDTPTVESYLAAARRSARAAAAQETERNASLGALRWGTPAAADAAPKKKSNALVIGLLVLIALFICAAAFLRWQAMNRPAEVTQPIAAAPAKPTAKADTPTLHLSASETPPAPQVIRPGQSPEPTNVAARPQPAAPQHGAPQQAMAQPAPQQQAHPTPVAPLDRLTQAANAGNARAQLIVGIKYLDDTPTNLTEAVKWLTKAADAGEPVAQYRLGGLYERGRGVTTDPVKAVRLYLAAATQGNRKAMHNLAVAYAEGTGVKKDFAEASRWFLKAANLGLSDSQFNLAVLYERGYGVPQNLVDAYKWYAIAAAGGDGESKTRMNAIASQLDADARAAAQHAVEAFRAAPLNARANVAPALGDVTRG
jgi:localization factor PodJL